MYTLYFFIVVLLSPSHSPIELDSTTCTIYPDEEMICYVGDGDNLVEGD